MTRLVQRFRNGPYVVTVAGEIRTICGCGLSGTLPFCDGTHRVTKTEQPGKLYWYDSHGQRRDTSHKYPDIRSDESAKSDSPAQTAPATSISAQHASDR